MKKKTILILFCVLTVIARAQVKQVPITKLEISYDKSLHLIFDKNVKYINGALDIVAKTNETLPYIVKVNVNNENFEGSRGLSIITADGIFHSFELVYKKDVAYSAYYENASASRVVTNINVATDKSTHLIFPSKIVYSDVGNDSTLTSEVITSSNILKVTALTSDKVLPTSLFVVTEDKKYYEFVMNSNPEASTYTYNFSSKAEDAIFDNTSNEKTLSEIAEKCLKQKRLITSVGERKNKLTCYLENVNIHNDVLYFTYEIINTSNLNMNIDFIRCYIKDKATIKNSPEQEIESTPILNYKYQTVIENNTSNRFVLAFPKFTIPDKKKFDVQIYDKDGGRHLSFSIKDDFIINAKPI